MLLALWVNLATGAELCPPLDKQGRLRIDPQAMTLLEACIDKAPSTKSLHFNDKSQSYSTSRQQLHHQIIDKLLQNKPCRVDKPIALLTGGYPGAGKTSYLNKKIPRIKQHFIIIDADDIRAQLPEYKGWNAFNTQAEVKDIVTQVLDSLGRPCVYNVIYDASMSDPQFYMEFINQLKDKGYKVYIIYLQIPFDIAIQRANLRYLETGRYVSSDFLNHVRKEGLNTFNTIKNEVDGYMVVDGLTTKVIKEGGDKIPKNL